MPAERVFFFFIVPVTTFILKRRENRAVWPCFLKLFLLALCHRKKLATKKCKFPRP